MANVTIQSCGRDSTGTGDAGIVIECGHERGRVVKGLDLGEDGDDGDGRLGPTGDGEGWD